MSADPPQPPGASTLVPATRLRRLVAGWRTLQKRRPQQQRYRQLVRYYTHQKHLSVKEYRVELRAARLDASRVSAIGCILDDPAVTEAFLQAENPLTYGAAVRQARKNFKARCEEESPDRSATEASEATPTCGPKLSRFWRQLKKLKPSTSPWQVDCGLFELRFTPDEPATANTGPGLDQSSELKEPVSLPQKLVIPISPETAEKLDRLAARSGLNRSETAVELIRRALLAFPAELATGAERKSATGSGKSLQFGLQRRKNPARTIRDQRRLPVALSLTDRENLVALGAGCGLSPNAIANLLLEPDAPARFSRLQAARDAAALERQRTIAPDPFPDLGKAVPKPANG